MAMATLTPNAQGSYAVLTTSNLPPAGHAITAVYGGDDTFSGNSHSLSLTVQAPTSDTLHAGPPGQRPPGTRPRPGP
ncbi:MAG TPA: hypothetical protein DDY78_02490, partial [Planctomycetales bacterium]|nr:hypothetical protein [Planctomycetales bacterium]